MAAEAESARDARAKVRSPQKGDSFVITHRSDGERPDASISGEARLVFFQSPLGSDVFMRR